MDAPRPLVLTLLALMAVSACKRTAADPAPVAPLPDTEQITTVRYTLTPTDGSAPIWAQSRDLDGNGGAPPVITYSTSGGRLLFERTKTYAGKISLLNESVVPADTVSHEVEAEASQHLFVFRSRGLLFISCLDRDSAGFDLGLLTRAGSSPFVTGTGTLQITLKHRLPTKWRWDDPSAIDADVTFQVEVPD